MVTIDSTGNKVNSWVEHRFDTDTNEIVEIEHTTLLAEADDNEHWRSRTTIEPGDDATFCSMFIYGSNEVLDGINKLLNKIKVLLYNHLSPESTIPLQTLMRVLVGENCSDGLVHRSVLLHNEILTLVVECDPKSAESLRDALFEIFPNINYIEIVY